MTRNLPLSTDLPYAPSTVDARAAENPNGTVVVEATFGNEFAKQTAPMTLSAARLLRDRLNVALREAEDEIDRRLVAELDKTFRPWKADR